MDSLLEKGYVELGEDDQYKVADFNRYKDLEDLVIFSQYKNQAFTDKEVNEIRELKIGLDLLAVKLIDVPLAEETYLGLKATLAEPACARRGRRGRRSLGSLDHPLPLLHRARRGSRATPS